MRGRIVLPLVMLLNACVPASQPEVATRGSIAASDLPPMKNFRASQPVAPTRSNRDLATDFIDLTFQMESGRKLPVLTRFETPITVRVTGRPSATLGSDLTRLMSRLRSEARIDIKYTTDPDANITINAVSRADIHHVLPQAACLPMYCVM